MFRNLFLICFCLSLSRGWAGDARGSGGYVVVCDREGEQTVELLDFYEGREFRGFEIDLGPADAPWIDQVEVALKRLEDHDPSRVKRYRAEAKSFESEALWKANIKLVPSEDSFHLALPEGCTAEQSVTHREPLFKEDKRYLVSNKYWTKLTETGRAGLVLHEIIFRETRSRGQTDSLRARYFNTLICSTVMKDIKAAEYQERLNVVGLGFRI